MKKWLFALPVAATAGAIAANLPGFMMGGPREGWELAVTLGYLAAWALFLYRGGERWQLMLSVIWWLASMVCCAVCFGVVTFGWDGFLMIFPAMAFGAPMSGLAVLTGRVYPVFYCLCTILSAGYMLWAWRKTK